MFRRLQLNPNCLLFDRTGAISQTLTYPLDVLRRKMQVRGMGTALGPQYNGAMHALVVIVRNEGIAGLYRGIWANLCECPLSGRDPGVLGPMLNVGSQ